MAQKIDARLVDLGIELPVANPPVANYVPYTFSGNLIFLSGQIAQWNGDRPYIGRVGAEVSVEDGIAAARLCGLNLIAWIKHAAGGDLDRVGKIVKLGGFVSSGPEFFDQPKIVNGCSDLFVAVFGEIGRHARTAIGTHALPFNVAVEVDAIVELKP